MGVLLIMEAETDNLTIKVFDVVLRFSTNCSETMNEIRRDFGPFETNSTFEPDGTVNAIETEDEFPLRIPRYAIREAFLPPASNLYSKSNLSFLQKEKSQILRFDFELNELSGYFRNLREHATFLRFLLKWLLIRTLEKKGIAFVHGSGVKRDEASLFFVGPQGSGKTHTLISFLLDGYQLITDDTILLKNERVLPFHLRSMIHEDMIMKFPILRKGLNKTSTFIPDQGWLIDLGSIFPVQKTKVYPSKLFYVNVWNSNETKVESIPKKEMLNRLLSIYKAELDNTIWFNKDKDIAMRRIFPNYGELVEKADCFRVYAGSDALLLQKTIQET
jgi:hypothetical protein